MRILWLLPVCLVLAGWLAACEPNRSSTSHRQPSPPPAPTAADPAQVYYISPDGDDTHPGTHDQPWATIGHAAQVLKAGELALIRGGVYRIDEQIALQHAGQQDAWIVYAGYPGEEVVIDASGIVTFAPADKPPYPHDQGAFQIEGVSYICVQNLTVKNSHNAGFTVRDSHHIDLINLTTDTTFSSGIAVWDTDHDGRGCHHIRVLGNSVTRANTFDMLLPGRPRGRETPHEAITIAGAHYFEVAYNHIYNCDKEGIDVKETSSHGTVHHNHVHHMDRQGLYVDSWFGVLEDVELYQNVVHHCQGAGIVISVEGGKEARDIRIHHNLIYDNLGTGVFFSRWGDGPRSGIQIHNNTVHHNGYGPANPGTEYHWITGGLYLFSTNLRDIDIRNNILSDNKGFQIGYSEHYLGLGPDIIATLTEKGIAISHNLVYDRNNVDYPIYAGWGPDDYANIYALSGENAILAAPAFVDETLEDYRLSPESPAIESGSPEQEYNDADGSPNDIGAYAARSELAKWWQGDFPPRYPSPNIPSH